MKKFILEVLSFISSLPPDRANHILMKAMLRNKRLIDRYGMSYISEVAAQLNIVGVSVRGDYGIFCGAPNDGSILTSYARKGQWAASTNEIIKSFFADGHGTYLDVGANIGLTVVPIATQSEVNCFVFEPDPANFRNLTVNICANCAKDNVKAFNLALFDRKSVLPFEISPSNLGDHRIRLGNAKAGRVDEEKRQVIEVQCVRLDDMNLPIHGPLFVKIDTQGAEPFVISGGSRTLAEADAVLLEWAPYCMSRMGGDPNVVLDFLKANFTTVKILDAESQKSEAPVRSIAEAGEMMAESFAKWRDDPARYFDVLAERT
jgi:FkbM family methyltransferase